MVRGEAVEQTRTETTPDAEDREDSIFHKKNENR